MVSSRTREDNVNAVMFGADVPLILGPVPDGDGSYQRISTAYWRSTMYNEAMIALGLASARKEVDGFVADKGCRGL